MKQASKQNISRNIEIKNKLIVTRGERERDIGGKYGKIHQGTCIKDCWTKPKGVCSRVADVDGCGEGPWWGENRDNYT